MTLRALRAPGRKPAKNFGLEDVLLESFRGGAGLLLFYVNEPCLVIGRNQNPWRELAPQAGLPVFRRVSGGGAVYHDEGNLNWSLIVPRNRHDPEAELLALARVLGTLGLELLPGPRGGLFGAPGSSLAGRKVSGTARRFTSRAVLHHGTLLVAADLGRLAASLGGLSMIEDRALPSNPSEVANLREARPGLEPETVMEHLARELCEGPPRPVEVDAELLERAVSRFSSWAWTYGESPPFTAELLVPSGPKLLIRNGRVSEAIGPGAEHLSAFLGEAFDYSTVARAAAVFARHEERRKPWTTEPSSTPSSGSSTRCGWGSLPPSTNEGDPVPAG